MERQNEKLSVSKLGDALKLYEAIVDLCFEILYDISADNYGTDLNEPKITSFLVATRILPTLQSVRHLTVKGYYFQASILLRSFFESLGLCMYLSNNFEEAERYTEGKKLNATSVDLFKYIPKTLYKEHYSNIKAIYGILCDYVHANYISLIESSFFPDKSDLKLIDGKERIRARIYIPSKFDKEKVTEIPFFPLLLLSALLKIFKEELNGKLKKIEKRFHDFVIKYDDILEANNIEDTEKN